MLVNERFQLANKLGVQSEVELCLDASFESGEAKLLETPALDRERGDVDDVAERAAMPERKSLPKPISRDARRPSRQRGLTFPDEQLEPSGVHLCLLELEYVATPASNQCGIGPQERARKRDTYERSVFTAPGGGRPCQSSSTNRSDGTTWPASSSSSASTERCFGPLEGKVTACPDGPHRAKDTQIERCSPGRRMRVQLHASIVHRPTSVDNCAGEPAVYGAQESAVE